MFKNWKTICAVEDANFKLALALLDMKSALATRLICQLPEFFCHEEMDGPLPLSVLQKKSCEYAVGDKLPYDRGKLHLHCYNAIPGSWPVVEFGIDYTLNENPELNEAPAEIQALSETDVGSVINWNGADIVLVDCCCDGTDWIFVPVELISVDTEWTSSDDVYQESAPYNPHQCVSVDEVSEAIAEGNSDKIARFKSIFSGNCPLCKRAVMIAYTKHAEA